MTIFWLALFGIVSSAWSETAPVAASAVPAFSSQDDFNRWSSFYYVQPNPERVVPAIRFMAESGILEEETQRAPTMAFLAEIFRQNEGSLTAWLKQLEDLKERQQQVLWHALWFSNCAEASALLLAFRYRTSAEGKELIDRLLKEEPPDLLSLPVSSPAVLDMLWGTFYVSGDERCVQRVISALPLSKPKGDLEKFLIGEAARWSLVSNAAGHERVLKICRKEAKGQSKEVRVVLAKVIEEASKGKVE